jgi:pimeloyl-ACP methyl ester carboxylesterase
MHEPLPSILVPGLNCSARLYAEQIPVLWRFGPVVVADHTRDDSMDAIARRILDDAPPRFALAGLSMGGYIALTMVRHAPERVVKLALLDSSARPETPEQTERRKPQIALAQAGASPRCRRCSFRSSSTATGRTIRSSERACVPWQRRPEPRPSCASSTRS